jgi:hypothetical protein
MASIISAGFAEQRDAWSAERSALETTTRECASRFEKAADAAALSAARIAERTFSIKRVPRSDRADVRGPTSPRPPRSPTVTQSREDSMESLTDISASSAETRRRSPGRPASPRAFGDADAGRVRIRGRNLRPQPPSAGSSPATSPRSPRSVSPRRRARGFSTSQPPIVSVWKTSTRRRSARSSPSPASAAAAEAAETCARLVDRLERLRAADAAARRRGWPSGDDARARETEAWLQRERASLGSFRRVAALVASS